MAFFIQNWSRVTTSGNEPLVNQLSNQTATLNQTVAVLGCYRIYSYYGATYTANAVTGDSQATMAAAGYFNAVSADLSIGDLIIAYSLSDNTYQTYAVTAVITPTVANVTIIATAIDPVATFTLTAAQVLAMTAGPIAAPNLPAPGAGLVYQVTNWAINMITGGAPTVYANGSAIQLTYGNGGPLAAATIPATVLTTGTPNNLGMAGGAAAFGAASAAYVNTGIFITTAGAAFINGTSPITVSVNFRVLQAF
jgi:hypothetical protein